MFGIPGPYFEPLAIQERQSATTRKGPVFIRRQSYKFESRGLMAGPCGLVSSKDTAEIAQLATCTIEL